LVVTARTQQALEKLQKEYPDQVECLIGDMADMSTGPKAVDLAKSKWNKLDGLIINHGVLEPVERIAKSDVEDWRKAFDVNFFAAVSLVRNYLDLILAIAN
jgi:NADP-dependent 3-hydroxy acid dehydrogenase YdfG